MEKSRGKRAGRGKPTNSIHLNNPTESVEESKDDDRFRRRNDRRRLVSSDSNTDSFMRKKISPHNNRNNSITVVNRLAGEGTVFKENGDDRIFVIKDNGLVVDMNQPDLKTVTKEIRSIPFTVKDPTSSLVTLLKSQFKERTETFYFPYPDFCIEEKEENKRVLRIEQDDFTPLRAYYRYDTDTHIYNAVVRACNEAGLFLK